MELYILRHKITKQLMNVSLDTSCGDEYIGEYISYSLTTDDGQLWCTQNIKNAEKVMNNINDEDIIGTYQLPFNTPFKGLLEIITLKEIKG